MNIKKVVFIVFAAFFFTVVILFSYWYVNVKTFRDGEQVDVTPLGKAKMLITTNRSNSALEILKPLLSDPTISKDEKSKIATWYGISLITRESDKINPSFDAQQHDIKDAFSTVVAELATTTANQTLSLTNQAEVYNFITYNALMNANDTRALEPLRQHPLLTDLATKAKNDIESITSPTLLATPDGKLNATRAIDSMFVGYIADKALTFSETKYSYLAKLRGLYAFWHYIKVDSTLSTTEKSLKVKELAQISIDTYGKMQSIPPISFDQQPGRQQIYDIAKWYNFMSAHELGVGEDQALQALHDAAYANVPNVPGMKSKIAFLRMDYAISLYDHLHVSAASSTEVQNILTTGIVNILKPIVTDTEFLGPEYINVVVHLQHKVIPSGSHDDYITTTKKVFLTLAHNDPASQIILSKLGLKE